MSPEERREHLVDATLNLLRVHGRVVTTKQIAGGGRGRRGHDLPRLRPARSRRRRHRAGLRTGRRHRAIEEIDPDLPLRDRLVPCSSRSSSSASATFELMQRVGLVGPPRHLHDGDAAQAWRAARSRCSPRSRRRPGPVRVPADEFVHVLRPADLRGQPPADLRRAAAASRGDRRHRLTGLFRPGRSPDAAAAAARAARAVQVLLALVVLFQFIGVVAMLCPPTLNADIIDNGIVTGDTGYIVRTGGEMLAISLGQIVCSVLAVWFGARTAMSFGRDVRRDLFARVGAFSTREMQRTSVLRR